MYRLLNVAIPSEGEATHDVSASVRLWAVITVVMSPWSPHAVVFLLLAAGYISLSQTGSVCSNFSVLSCSFRNVLAVRLQDFDSEDNRFNTLSSNRIARNPDYVATSADDVYELQITHPERYNGSLYRCFGFDDEDFGAQYSNQWKLSIPSEFIIMVASLRSRAILSPALWQVFWL